MITAREADVLEHAARIADGLISSCVAITPLHGQQPMFNRLLKRGLLKAAGRGVDVDDHLREVDLYTITDAGRAALASHRKQAA